MEQLEGRRDERLMSTATGEQAVEVQDPRIIADVLSTLPV